MHSDGAALRDAGTDSIRPFYLFRPDGSAPNPPVAQLGRSLVIASVFDGNSGGVTEEDDVSRLSHNCIQPIELRLGSKDQAFDRLPKVAKLACG